MAYRFCHEFQQRGDNLKTGQFDIHDILAPVNLGVCHAFASFVSLSRRFGNVVDEATFKGAGQDFFFIVQKHLHAFTFQATDDTGTQVDDLFVDVTDVLQVFPDTFLAFFLKEAQQ